MNSKKKKAANPAGKPHLALCISIDVEEEGLFSGVYPARGCSVDNVRLLHRLAPLREEYGIPLTLLCSWAVFSDADACKTLESMRDGYGAEIGAHLHHWSEPPFAGLDENGAPLRSVSMPREALRKRLETLLEAGEKFQGAPLTSFRMGRWDMNASWRPMLEEMGIRTDSSVCPLRVFKNGPDHFSAPADPFRPEGGSLLEVPITQIPIFPALSRIWEKSGAKASPLGDYFHFFGALSANPFWHGPRMMRLCAKLHAARGGKVLSLFWHSSEMLPGASPHVRNEGDARRKLEEIGDFCRWLGENFILEPLTLEQINKKLEGEELAPPLHEGGDWLGVRSSGRG